MRDSQAEAQRWLRQAERDLSFARLALRERYWVEACFVAQQHAALVGELGSKPLRG
jgi:HEPN domain-containing protein